MTYAGMLLRSNLTEPSCPANQFLLANDLPPRAQAPELRNEDLRLYKDCGDRLRQPRPPGQGTADMRLPLLSWRVSSHVVWIGSLQTLDQAIDHIARLLQGVAGEVAEVLADLLEHGLDFGVTLFLKDLPVLGGRSHEGLGDLRGEGVGYLDRGVELRRLGEVPGGHEQLIGVMNPQGKIVKPSTRKGKVSQIPHRTGQSPRLPHAARPR